MVVLIGEDLLARLLTASTNLAMDASICWKRCSRRSAGRSVLMENSCMGWERGWLILLYDLVFVVSVRILAVRAARKLLWVASF